MQFVLIIILCFTANSAIGLFVQQVYSRANFSSIFIIILTCWYLPFVQFSLSTTFYTFLPEVQLTSICLLSEAIIIRRVCPVSTCRGKPSDLTRNINLLKQPLADQILDQNWEALLTSTLETNISSA